ncbi:hypothetical protein DC522_01370 [Microvirga sp. KLBC 81]|uniref:hypothetical protein n=1 Tax=Microvirga sp. KLBC 81 TaxID=1862707 RepID=UPI000D5193A4|nr:hypothetical protein [Microvirga sp. KLBC 81]PVE26441.1 hypothetical protein DC522_01370 [Microvirga sp. KLBC 81]
MITRTLLLGLLALGAMLPTAALAQADQILRNPDGTVVDPVLRYPDGTPVPATAPIVPREIIVNIPPRDVDVAGAVLPVLPQRVDRPGCAVQGYVVGPNQRVRVHRC